MLLVQVIPDFEILNFIKKLAAGLARVADPEAYWIPKKNEFSDINLQIRSKKL